MCLQAFQWSRCISQPNVCMICSAKKAIQLCECQEEEFGHPQPPMRLRTDDTTAATGFIQCAIKQKRSQTHNRRFLWLKGAHEFTAEWSPGIPNSSDCSGEHHTDTHCERIRPIHLCEVESSPVSLQGCVETKKKHQQTCNVWCVDAIFMLSWRLCWTKLHKSSRQQSNVRCRIAKKMLPWTLDVFQCNEWWKHGRVWRTGHLQHHQADILNILSTTMKSVDTSCNCGQHKIQIWMAAWEAVKETAQSMRSTMIQSCHLTFTLLPQFTPLIACMVGWMSVKDRQCKASNQVDWSSNLSHLHSNTTPWWRFWRSQLMQWILMFLSPWLQRPKRESSGESESCWIRIVCTGSNKWSLLCVWQKLVLLQHDSLWWAICVLLGASKNGSFWGVKTSQEKHIVISCSRTCNVFVILMHLCTFMSVCIVEHVCQPIKKRWEIECLWLQSARGPTMRMMPRWCITWIVQKCMCIDWSGCNWK